MQRYYSTQRPVSIGTYPKPQGNKVLNIVNYGKRVPVREIERDAWGYIDYEEALSEEDVERYELYAMPEKSALLESFEKFYELLCTGEADEDSEDCRKLLEVFDTASRICCLRARLVEERGDFIVSDREVKALMFALEEQGEVRL